MSLQTNKRKQSNKQNNNAHSNTLNMPKSLSKSNFSYSNNNKDLPDLVSPRNNKRNSNMTIDDNFTFGRGSYYKSFQDHMKNFENEQAKALKHIKLLANENQIFAHLYNKYKEHNKDLNDLNYRFNLARNLYDNSNGGAMSQNEFNENMFSPSPLLISDNMTLSNYYCNPREEGRNEENDDALKYAMKLKLILNGSTSLKKIDEIIKGRKKMEMGLDDQRRRYEDFESLIKSNKQLKKEQYETVRYNKKIMKLIKHIDPLDDINDKLRGSYKYKTEDNEYPEIKNNFNNKNKSNKTGSTGSKTNIRLSKNKFIDKKCGLNLVKINSKSNNFNELNKKHKNYLENNKFNSIDKDEYLYDSKYDNKYENSNTYYTLNNSGTFNNSRTLNNSKTLNDDSKIFNDSKLLNDSKNANNYNNYNNKVLKNDSSKSPKLSNRKVYINSKTMSPSKNVQNKVKNDISSTKISRHLSKKKTGYLSTKSLDTKNCLKLFDNYEKKLKDLKTGCNNGINMKKFYGNPAYKQIIDKLRKKVLIKKHKKILFDKSPNQIKTLYTNCEMSKDIINKFEFDQKKNLKNLYPWINDSTDDPFNLKLKNKEIRNLDKELIWTVHNFNG